MKDSNKFYDKMKKIWDDAEDPADAVEDIGELMSDMKLTTSDLKQLIDEYGKDDFYIDRFVIDQYEYDLHEFDEVDLLWENAQRLNKESFRIFYEQWDIQKYTVQMNKKVFTV